MNLTLIFALIGSNIFISFVASYFFYSKFLRAYRKFFGWSGQPEIEFDEESIPLNDYGRLGGIGGTKVGRRYNPVSVCLIALELYRIYKNEVRVSILELPKSIDFEESELNISTVKKWFLDLSNWLLKNKKNRRDLFVWEYDFPVYGFSENEIDKPWISSLAQGLAISVLLKAYELTNDDKYLEATKKALKAFSIPISEGGILYLDTKDQGWWYPEFGYKNPPFALNGFVFSLLSLHEYYEFMKSIDPILSDKAKDLFNRGVLELKTHLEEFDAGYGTYYDLRGLKASLKYHKLHVWQMQQLYSKTKEEIFKEFHDRWDNYTYKMEQEERRRILRNRFFIFILLLIIFSSIEVIGFLVYNF
ncbi:MAG: hypothetical protein HWN67_05870 [Candidatus Helarchaeota archaeon]|nr:hypothetical protein [Candidatus Helarchaeota archaeon]